MAVEGPEASRLLGASLGPSPSKREPGVGTACVYFKADRAPRQGPMLYLNGEVSAGWKGPSSRRPREREPAVSLQGSGLVNNCCFPSEVAASYAPPGKTLVSVSTVGVPALGDAELAAAVKSELSQWFGAGEVSNWQLLRVYRIPYAQPPQSPPTDLRRPVALGNGLFVCGDHRDAATLEGALTSGKRAAQALLASN